MESTSEKLWIDLSNALPHPLSLHFFLGVLIIIVHHMGPTTSLLAFSVTLMQTIVVLILQNHLSFISFRRKLRSDISKAFPGLSQDDIQELIPNKEEITVMKVLTHSGHNIPVYFLNGEPMFFEMDRQVIPSGNYHIIQCNCTTPKSRTVKMHHFLSTKWRHKSSNLHKSKSWITWQPRVLSQ